MQVQSVSLQAMAICSAFFAAILQTDCRQGSPSPTAWPVWGLVTAESFIAILLIDNSHEIK